MEPKNKKAETTSAVIVYYDENGEVIPEMKQVRTLTKEQAAKRDKGATDENIMAE